MAKEKAEQASTATQQVQSNSTVATESKPSTQPSQVQSTTPAQTTQSSGNATSAQFTFYYPANDAMQGGGITATGFNIWNGQHYQGYRVLAAPPAYAFGTLLKVTYGGQSFTGVVLDRGGAIQGNTFDIAVADRQTAINGGRQSGTVEVVGKIAY